MTWHCEYCLRDFQTENGLMRHFCREREKLDLLRSPLGQAAYAYYAEWMRLQRRSVPDQDRFMHSKQFNHMVKFAEWSDKTSIPNPKQFIKLMIESGTQPALWCRDSTYSLYLDWYDSTYPPEQQFIETLDYIKQNMWENEGGFGEEPFAGYSGREIASLIRRRKLSPWLLIMSEAFLRWLKKLEAHEGELISEAINYNAFIDKIKARPELAKEFKAACKAEGL